MRSMIIKRLASIPLTLFIASILIFLLTAVVPGDVARRTLGREATQEAVELRREQLGLDRPLVVQYTDWLGGLLTGDFGDSYVRNEPVAPVVADRLVSSIALAGYALALMVPLGIGLGIVAGLRPGTRTDRVISVGGLSVASVPDFVTGVVLLVVFAVQLQWFPTSARAPAGASLGEHLHRMALPALVLTLATAGYLSRLVRTSTIATNESAFVRTAVLKGLPRRTVIGRHLLRNSLMPTVSALGIQISYLIGALVTVELLFNYQGLGYLLLEASLDKDVPMLQAASMVTAVVYMLCILGSDIAYGVLDPRVRYSEAAT